MAKKKQVHNGTTVRVAQDTHDALKAWCDSQKDRVPLSAAVSGMAQTVVDIDDPTYGVLVRGGLSKEDVPEVARMVLKRLIKSGAIPKKPTAKGKAEGEKIVRGASRGSATQKSSPARQKKTRP